MTTWTKDVVSGICERIRGKAVENFRKDGSLAPVIVLFATLPTPTMMILLVANLDGVDDDESFRQAVRHLAEKHGAATVAYVWEAWTLVGEAAANHDGTSLADHADHREALIFEIESQRFPTEMWRSDVSGDGTRSPGEWMQYPPESPGRFFHCLQAVS